MATTWRAKTPIGEDAAKKAWNKNWANMSQSRQETMDKVTAARDEADNEVKRESRGVPKPANFDAIQESRQGAKDAADRKKISDMGYKKGGKVSSASSRADGCATKGKTKGTMISMNMGGKA